MMTRHLQRTIGPRVALAGIVCVLANPAAAQGSNASGPEPIVSQARPLITPAGATFLAAPSAADRRPLKLTVDWLVDARVDAVPQDERVVTGDRPRSAWRIVLGAAVGGVGGSSAAAFSAPKSKATGVTATTPV